MLRAANQPADDILEPATDMVRLGTFDDTLDGEQAPVVRQPVRVLRFDKLLKHLVHVIIHDENDVVLDNLGQGRK